MTNATLAPRRITPLLGRLRAAGHAAMAIPIALVIYGGLSAAILSAYPEASIRFRLSIDPLRAAETVIQVHVAAAVASFLIGLVLFAAPKGFRFHKTLGWTWLAAMTVTAVSSFFMVGLNGMSLSWIHGLSAWTLVAMPMGLAAIRKRDVKRHREAMTGLFMGAMVIAGLFAFLPGRLMWQLFFVSA